MKAITLPTSVAEDAASAMEVLLTTSKYSDLTIKCQDYIFKVHRSVVCTRSKPLAAAIDGQFKESLTGEIDLSEDEPMIVDKLVSFLYTRDFDEDTTIVKHASVSKQKSISRLPTQNEITGSSLIMDPVVAQPNGVPDSHLAAKSWEGDSEPETDPPKDSIIGPLVTLAKVYIIADTFDIPALKDLARAKYETVVQDSWNGPEFAESIRLLYLNTREKDRGIKDIAIKTAQINVKALLDRGEFRTLLKDIGEVALDVLHSAIHDKRGISGSTMKSGKCKDCNCAVTCPNCNDDNELINYSLWFCTNPHCSYRKKHKSSCNIRCNMCQRSDFIEE